MRKQRSTETRTLVYPAGAVNPEDLLSFVHFPAFTRAWKHLKLTDDELRVLEICIMVDPKGPPVVRGTGGLRKARFAPGRWNTGKSGGLRIGYCYVEAYSVVGLIVAYPKSGKENLTKEERNLIKTMIERFHQVVENGSG
jgi:hypothetical protein